MRSIVWVRHQEDVTIGSLTAVIFLFFPCLLISPVFGVAVCAFCLTGCVIMNVWKKHAQDPDISVLDV